MEIEQWKCGQRMLVAAVLWPLLPGIALAAPHAPAMTGAQFVKDMLATPDGGPASLRRERAVGYVDGVMDGAAGVRWCPAGRAVAHELSYIVAEDIQRLPIEQRKASAAQLALATLSRLYPCTTRAGKP